MKIEVGKFYKTRDGMKVRVYALDGGDPDFPVHGAIYYKNDRTHDYENEGWESSDWAEDGTSIFNTIEDIVDEWSEGTHSGAAFRLISAGRQFGKTEATKQLFNEFVDIPTIKPRKGWTTIKPEDFESLWNIDYEAYKLWGTDNPNISDEAREYLIRMCSCGGKLNTHKPTCPENKKDETVYETHPFYYIDESPERYVGMKPFKKCECGSDSLNSPKHSSYCPKFEE